MTTEKSYTGWYFLLGVVITYVVTAFINLDKVFLALSFFKNIFFNVIPVLFFIFVLMSLTNYFVKPKMIVKHLGKNSKFLGWIIVIFGGILSSGPIYMWYPLLNDLQKHGMRTAFIATFLYNRAVKIPLLPLIISYFGLQYTITLLVVMVLVSILQGIATEKICNLIN